MPYIPLERRIEINPVSHMLFGAMTPGELNYQITEIVLRYVNHNELSYQTINDVMGALASAAQEFYRRAAAPYEDIKRDENGDVYQ